MYLEYFLQRNIINYFNLEDDYDYNERKFFYYDKYKYRKQRYEYRKKLTEVLYKIRPNNKDIKQMKIEENELRNILSCMVIKDISNIIFDYVYEYEISYNINQSFQD